MLFQENNLFNHLTIRQNISLGIHPGLKLNREQQAQVTAIAGQMGIDALLERLPGELSGGQRQRAALARCLVRQQPVLLLDEPFSALDPALRQEMLSLVADVCEQQQLTLLMVSHSVEDAARIAPRSMVVAEGRIVWDGATAELLSGHSSASHLMGISARAASATTSGDSQSSRPRGSQRVSRSPEVFALRHSRQHSHPASQASSAAPNSSHLKLALFSSAGISIAAPARMPGRK